MRYITIENTHEGMVLAKPIYNLDSNVLLAKGMTLKRNYIQAIDKLGIPGIYIQDDISDDVVYDDVISDELRNAIGIKLKDMFLDKNDNNSWNQNEKIFQQNLTDMKHLVQDAVEQIISNKTVQINMMDLKAYNNYTYSHSVNVLVLSLIIGTAMELNQIKLHHLGMAAILHDIGKMFISESILNKPDKLTEKEFDQIKEHTMLGYKCLRDQYQLPLEVCSGALFHHERYGGSGYPTKKQGDDIPLFGRIIAIADVYDAITSKRSYHDAILPSDAIEYIMANEGIHFDPEILRIFLKKIAVYPLGISVELSNGQKGLVVKNYDDLIMRPKVKIIEKGEITGEFIDLAQDKTHTNLTIVKVNVDLEH